MDVGLRARGRRLMKAKVRWKPIGLSAKRWRETAHLRSLQGSTPYSKPPKRPRLKAPRDIMSGQITPRLRRMPKPAEGLPTGGENTF